MVFVSLTRLKIRSFRFVPLFAVDALRSVVQVRKSSGFRGGALLTDRDWTFWTMTTWDSQENMRAFMNSGAHKHAMPHLLNWCDEASVAHWTQGDASLPSWTEASEKMRQFGRPSKVRNPSPQHANLDFRAPRSTATLTIHPA
ncbi:MAG: DUF3291 domain-containing protein [Acidobacteriaceae bacterium]